MIRVRVTIIIISTGSSTVNSNIIIINIDSIIFSRFSTNIIRTNIVDIIIYIIW